MLRLFKQAGWNIAYKKSNLIASQSLLYQGFISNSLRMMYYTSGDKQSKYLNSLRNMLAEHNHEGSIHVKIAASVLGKIQSLKKSHGSVVSVIPRNTYNELGRQVIIHGWNSKVTFRKGLQELEFFLHHLHTFNGKAISNAKLGAMTVTQREVGRMINNIKQTAIPIPNLLLTDASEERAFSLFHGEIVELQNYEFNSDEKTLSSGHRELLALISFMQYNISINKKFSAPIIYWETDSQLCYYFLHHGSKNSDTQKQIVKVKLMEIQLAVTIIPVWTRRSHCRMLIADEGSRFSSDSDLWGIPRFMLNSIFSYFNCEPTVDGFANHTNRICTKYISKFLDNENMAIDFFSHSPSEKEVYYLCPPVSKIGRTIRKIESTVGPLYILVCPMWTSASWWPLLHNGSSYQKLIRALFIFDCKPDLFHNMEVDTIFSKSMKFIAFLMHH